MKKSYKIFLGLLLAFLVVNTVLAQSPERFKYQAVLRDATGNILPNTPVTVFIDILQGSASGTSVYNESHSLTTTAQGVINLDIGGGTVNSGVFANIDWSANSYWVKVTLGGTVISTGQLLSVPYSLHVKGINRNPVTGNVGIGTTNPQSLVHLLSSDPRTNILVESNSATFGPELRLTSTAAGGHEWRIVSGASASNSYGAGSFELYDLTAATSRFGILPNGNVGIGTTTPVAKLDVAGTVRIADGTQGANKVLTSDASGNASWITNTGVTSAIIASLSSTAYTLTNSAGQYTGSFITLPPGKWSIQTNMLLPGDASSLWVRSSFSSSSSSFIQSPDIVGAPYASGYKAASAFGMLIGTVIINNTSGVAKTYYYWSLNIVTYSGTLGLSNFGTSLWLENQMVAYPMN